MKPVLWTMGAFAWGILQSSPSQAVWAFSDSQFAFESTAFRPTAFVQASSTQVQKKTFIPPQPPPNLSAPGNRNSTGSRGDDGQQRLTEQLVALVPTFEREVDSLKISQVWLLTASTHPTFWFYLPPSQASVAEFVIEQRLPSSGRRRYVTLYQQEVSLSQEGLIAVTLPQSFSGLETGQRYRWSLRLPASVSPEQRRKLQPIKGWVEFQPLSSLLEAQLKTASPIEVVQLYGQQGRWLDSLTVMAELYRAEPARYRANWQDLLTEIGLGVLAEQALVD